jgi:hypothetical protein
MSHTIEFRPSGRGKAQCDPDPAYPNGIAIDASNPVVGQGPHVFKPTCTVPLPYPAPERGDWIVRCQQCPMSVYVTAAGRPDDPISVTMSCRERKP